MSGRSVVGFAAVAIGAVLVIWGVAAKPLSVSSGGLMAYLIGGTAVATAGLVLIERAPRWLVMTLLWVTCAVTLVYLLAFDWQTWITSVVTVITVIAAAAWLTIVIKTRTPVAHH